MKGEGRNGEGRKSGSRKLNHNVKIQSSGLGLPTSNF